MKENDARDVIAMARGATTQWPVDDDTVTFWMHSLKSLDAEVATKAVILGSKTWDRFPAWSSFYEAYRAVQRQQQFEDRGARQIAEGKRGTGPPEWVWVWNWCRNYREPQEWRSLPQQEQPEEVSLTVKEYEALRDEWHNAGSPKEKGRSLVKSL